MKHLLTFLILINSLFVLGQYNINGTITGLENEAVFLMRITGDNRTIVDTAYTDITGAFSFEPEAGFPVGLYAVVAGPEQMIEIIYNHENIRFVTNGSSPDAQVQMIESIENLIYYDYLSLKGLNLYKLDLLDQLVFRYPQDDDFYAKTVAKVALLQDELTDRANQLIDENPESMAAHFIRVDKPVFAPVEFNPRQKKQYLKLHYFDHTDFNDTLLMRSNILTSRIISYLSLFQENGLNQEQLEDRLLMGVDTVLQKAFINQQVYEFVVDFLLNGFEAIGFERGLEHIAEKNLLNELCVNTVRKAKLENKMELIKKLAIGKTAPDFKTTDIHGDTITLSEINADKTILFFWASWCPHCSEMLPELKALYNAASPGSLQVVAVSIDEYEDDLLKEIKEKNLNWINIGELKGWDGPVVDEYGIVATPTIFVFDKNKTIIAKPRSIAEIKSRLE